MQSAFTTLAEKGYLVETSHNRYNFYRNPQNLAASSEAVEKTAEGVISSSPDVSLMEKYKLL